MKDKKPAGNKRKGFASRPENINRGGRPAGVSSRKPSKKEIDDSFAKSLKSNIQKYKDLLEHPATSNTLKATILNNLIKLGLDALGPSPAKEEPGRGKEKETGYQNKGSVVSFLK